jgi:hypothetical protein
MGGHFNHGRPGVHDDRVAWRDELGGRFANALLRFQIELGAFVKAEKTLELSWSGGGDGPAAIAEEGAGLLQLSQIVSDRDRRNAECSRQAGDVGGSVIPDQIENLIPAMPGHRGFCRNGSPFSGASFNYVYFHSLSILVRLIEVKSTRKLFSNYFLTLN